MSFNGVVLRAGMHEKGRVRLSMVVVRDPRYDEPSTACVGHPDSSFERADARSKGYRRVFTLAVLLIYLALGIAAYWTVLQQGIGEISSRSNQDPTWFVWDFGWVAHALVTGHNPFFTNAINVPSG